MLELLVRSRMVKDAVIASLSTTNNTDHNYKEAIRIINSLQSNSKTIEDIRTNRREIELKTIGQSRKYLERCGVTLDRLDTLSVIHVAGTKGKGSTSAFCESILRHHGYRTGFFSSPHLVSVRERVRINARPLNHAAFSAYVRDAYQRLRAQREDEHDMPPFFKFLSTVAFNVFLEEKVDVAIVEVGIGGEYDCTNVLRKVCAVGITSLGLDHTSILGHTIQEIAWQKAGIMKPGSVAFTSQGQPPSAMTVLRARAAERECPLLVSPPLESYAWGRHEPHLGISSDVQKSNASLALQLANHWIRHHSNHIESNGNVVAPNRLNGDETVSNCLNGVETVSDGLNGNVVAPNGLNGIETVSNCLNGDETVSNGLNGIETVSNGLNGNVVAPNGLNGIETVSNCLNGDETVSNGLNGNVVVPNGLNGDKTVLNGSKLQPLKTAATFPITSAMAQGLVCCQWPGRTQVISRGQVTYYLDGAHTTESMQVCADWFRQATQQGNTKRILIFNTTGDRNAPHFLETLFVFAFDLVIFCPNNVNTTQDHTSELLNLMVTDALQQARCEKNRQVWLTLHAAGDVRLVSCVADAVRLVQQLGQQAEVLVTGSLHLVGSVLSVIDPELTATTQHAARNTS